MNVKRIEQLSAEHSTLQEGIKQMSLRRTAGVVCRLDVGPLGTDCFDIVIPAKIQKQVRSSLKSLFEERLAVIAEEIRKEASSDGFSL